MDKEALKEQLQINLLQVFEDVGIGDEENFDNDVRDVILDHMCNVIIKTVNYICSTCKTKYVSTNGEKPQGIKWNDGHECNPVIIKNKKQ